MCKDNQIKSLKELVNKFLEISPFQKQLTEAMVRRIWHKYMPKVVCERTEKLYMHHNKLFVKIVSAPLRHELKFNKDKMLEMLRRSIATRILEDVIFL